MLRSIVERQKKKEVYGAVLTDFSKAFDCLPRRLLTSKPHAYGLSMHSWKLISSYFTEREQRARIGTCNCKRTWLTINKGAAQGAVMARFLFSVLANDLVKYLEDKCDVYNYPDDNTAGTSADTIHCLCPRLQRIAGVTLSWFNLNYMKANPGKFQFILFGKDNNNTLTNVLYPKVSL